MGKFICSETESGLVGFDNISDVSDLVGGDFGGVETIVDTSMISVS